MNKILYFHTTPTLYQVMYLFCTMAKSGISIQVSTVSSQERPNITESMRQVLTVLRTNALAFRATVRPILSTSECRREERGPGWWKRRKKPSSRLTRSKTMFIKDHGEAGIVCHFIKSLPDSTNSQNYVYIALDVFLFTFYLRLFSIVWAQSLRSHEGES